MDAERPIERLLRHLRDLVEDSDVPRRLLDDRLGHAEGYLSQLLAGSIDLKYRHLIAILKAIGCPPQRFFDLAFPLPAPKTAGGDAGIEAALAADKEVAEIYGFGIDAVRDLRLRLEQCEERLFGPGPETETADPAD